MVYSPGTSNISAAFIDLATRVVEAGLESVLYDEKNATNYFRRIHTPSIWFSQSPAILKNASGSPAFGSDFSVTATRSGDYLLQTWLRMKLPEVNVEAGQSSKFVSWTPMLAHNLIKECSISFNDMVAYRFDSTYLDFLAAFSTPAGKQECYDQMVGMTEALTTPAKSLPATELTLPLPMFFSKDTGLALEMCALPYNEVRINFSLRTLAELLTVWDIQTDVNGDYASHTTEIVAPSVHLTSQPELSEVQVWSNYAVVSNSHRKEMGQQPVDKVIEQIQSIPSYSYSPATNPYQEFSLRLSHAVKGLMFGVENVSITSYHSNYTTEEPKVSVVDGKPVIEHFTGVDPIDNTSLVYENSPKLSGMSSSYFSQVQPWYQPGLVCPTTTGYHVYSYALDLTDCDATGSTNYGRLNAVSIIPAASEEAKTANAAGTKFRFVLFGISKNILRISGGAAGFPIY